MALAIFIAKICIFMELMNEFFQTQMQKLWPSFFSNGELIARSGMLIHLWYVCQSAFVGGGWKFCIWRK